MKKLALVLLLIAAAPTFAQVFSGTSGGDVFVLPPYRSCYGADNGLNVCVKQSGNNVAQVNGQWDFQWPAKTVATLPSASSATGRTYRVTDGATTIDCSAGGGSISVLCTSDGTSWTAFSSGGAVNNSGNAGAVGFYKTTGTIISPDTCTTDGNGNETCNSYTTGGAGTGVVTFLNGAAPTAPASGKASTYVDSTTNNFTCLLNVGNCGYTGSLVTLVNSAAPTSPASGKSTLYTDSTANNLTCLLSSGYCGFTGNMLKMPGSGGNHTISINAAGSEMIFGGSGGTFAMNFCAGFEHISFNRDCASGSINNSSVAALDIHPLNTTDYGFDLYNGSGSFLGRQIDIGSLGLTNVSGVNSTYWLCSATYAGTNAGLSSALAQIVTNGGGTVIVPPGCTVSVTGSQAIGSSSVTGTLLIQNGGVINVNETDSGSTFKLGYYSSVECDKGGAINVTASAVITDLITNLNQNSTQEAAYTRGCIIIAANGATVSGAAIHWLALAANTAIQNTIAVNFPNKGVWFQGTAASGSGVANSIIDNSWFNGGGLTNAIPCAFTGDGTNAVGSVQLVNTVCEHGGAAQPNIDIEGTGGTLLHSPHSMLFSNVYCESLAAQTGPCMKIRDSHDILVSELQQNGNGTNDLVQISQSGAGLTYNIRLQSLYTNQTGQNLVNDSVCSKTIATTASNPGVVQYDMPCASTEYFGTARGTQVLADQGTACTNGELALSAGWGTTATVTAVVGTGQTCEWTLTSSGTGQAANPTITDTLTNALPSASTVCDMRMVGGTGTTTLIDQTTLSATAPVFTFGGTPVAASTYKVVRRCGP